VSRFAIAGKSSRPGAGGYTPVAMGGALSFEVVARDGRARAGLLKTPHGAVETPVFMPVGTAAAVKAVRARDLEEVGAQIVLANTYHLMLRPGDALVRDLGGLHGFTGWKRPFLTDSGGYQVFSLKSLRRLDERGVVFQSHLDGSTHELTPERSMEVQMNLGADVVMAFDECPPWPSPREAVAESAARTARWAERSRVSHTRADQWLFGIVQGGVFLDLREKSARETMALGFPGHAIGGVSVGEPKEDRLRVLDHLDPILPETKPRYLMGVGTPEDLVEGVARGIDMFDCVLPTRNARNGQLFTRRGRLSIRNARFRDDPRPPDPDCPCPTCRTTSRAYLRHLHQAGEMTAATLLTVHNLFVYLDIMRAMRQSIRLCRFEEFRNVTLRTLAATEADGS
jgi:queuine tRNA-ribosyltransferase